ncbi:MAG: DNA repair protein RadA [bacterium]|nr:DNA repair protein RadA [bacterium]
MKSKTTFVCLSCQQQFPRWSGKCPNCSEWNTLTEERFDPVESTARSEPAQLLEISQIKLHDVQRLKSGLKEFDQVLGADEPGIVPGSVVLIAGSPGVGKSTLLLQVASSIANSLYFSAEESLEQLKMRADRLGLKKNSILVSAERDMGRILAAVRANKPKLVVIDSIQTVFDETTAGTPGSLVQVREIVWRLTQFAKQNTVAFIVIGHITKEGAIAGPKVLEHLVDAVLYLEGEKRTGLRILHVEKNRYGPLDEVGIYQLTKDGFEAVQDPGKLFASLITEKLPGRALTITAEGSRSFLVEIQALSTKTSFGYPKRSCQGIDPNRLNVILAVLENRLNVPANLYDIFINVVGGFSLKDPGIDLAIAGAILSSITKKVLPDNVVLIGEMGLLGEIRPAHNTPSRIKEAKRLGYTANSKITSLKHLEAIFR